MLWGLIVYLKSLALTDYTYHLLIETKLEFNTCQMAYKDNTL